MVIKFSTAVALSCPACGCLEKEEVNIFELPLGELKQLKCSCGADKASLLRKENSYIELYYFCLNCNRAHKMVISPEKFWHSQNLSPLPCKEEGLNPGYFGPPEKVIKEIRKEKEELNLMAEELGFDDFKNPEIILQALDIIDDLALKGSISCKCGSEDINVELFSDRIQLICNNCGTNLNISASDNYDLEKLRHLSSIKLKNLQGKNPKDSLDPWMNL